MNIERQTADTLLQRPKRVEVAGKMYEVPVITAATLALFSEQVAAIGVQGVDAEHFYETLFENAGKSKDVARALAVLILGAKAVEGLKRRWWTRFVVGDALSRLTDRIYYGLPLEEMAALFRTLLEDIQPTVFFSLIIFLSGMNATKPTRTTEATASGQLSGAL